MEGKLKPIKKDVRKIRRDVSVMLDVLDRKDIELGKRITRVEDHLNFHSVN
ncbi:MAG: hypothetical protein ABID04_00590 [Patescibacteria group bacterium]